MAIEIISPRTAEVTVQAKIAITDFPSTISATGLATTETATIYFSVDEGQTWEAWSIDGAAVVLTATDKSIGVYSPILLGAIKSATVGLSGVYLTTPSGVGKL